MPKSAIYGVTLSIGGGNICRRAHPASVHTFVNRAKAPSLQEPAASLTLEFRPAQTKLSQMLNEPAAFFLAETGCSGCNVSSDCPLRDSPGTL